MSAARGEIAEIELLRAVAIAIVVLHHAGALLARPLALGLLVQSGGLASGVDLFFVISGFVIARGLVPELLGARADHRAGRVLAAFWLRRAFRLWPAAWLWLLIPLLLSLAGAASAHAALWRDMFSTPAANAWATLAGLLHYANIRFFLTAGRGMYGITLQYWSLSAEEQFYLVLPLLILLLGRRFLWPAWLLAIASVLPGTAILAQLGATRAAAVYDFALVHARYGVPFMGVLLAVHAARPMQPLNAMLDRMPALRRLLLPLLTYLCVLAGADRFATSGGHGWSGLCGAALVLLAAQDRGLLCPPRAIPAAIRWIGSRSYALYLTHVPVWLCVHGLCLMLAGGLDWHLAPLPRLAAIILGLAVMAALAELTYRLIEAPMRARGRAIAARILAPPAQRGQAA